MQSCVWHERSLAALAVLLDVLIACLRVEVEMAGHDPYCYWDAGFRVGRLMCTDSKTLIATMLLYGSFFTYTCQAFISFKAPYIQCQNEVNVW